MMLDHLDEPELEFGSGGRHVDIRFGMKENGALDRGTSRAPARLKVGIVGTPETVDGISAWLEHIRGGVAAKKSRQPNLFPPFPGEDPFGTSLALDRQLAATISQRTVTGLLAKARTAEGVAAAVDAFMEQVRHLADTASPDVIVVAPPAMLLGALEEEDEDQPEQTDVVSDEGEADGAEDLGKLPAFHDLLKARGLTLPRPLQMVRPETYDPRKRRRQAAHPERIRDLQDEATRAWNLYTALYYKAGGVPWRLPREAGAYTACFVGVSFYRTPDRERLLTSMAHVFNERGDGMIVRGGSAEHDQVDRQVHLAQDGARALLEKALGNYRLEHGTLPARVVVHKTSLFNEAERLGFGEAAEAQRIEELDLLTVGQSMTRLFRVGTYPPLRGTLLSLEDDFHVLYTRGSVDFFATYPGLYVPKPLRLQVAQSWQSARFLSEEVLSLTKMNWNNTQFDQRDPITIRAARQVGAILKYVEGDLPQGRYAYYM